MESDVLVQMFENKLNECKSKSIIANEGVTDKSNRYESVMNQISIVKQMNAALLQDNNELNGRLVERNSSSIVEIDKQIRKLKLENIGRKNEMESVSSMIAAVKCLLHSLRANQLNLETSSELKRYDVCDELANSGASQMTSLSQRMRSIAQLLDTSQCAHKDIQYSVNTVLANNLDAMDNHLQQVFNLTKDQNNHLNKQLNELNTNTSMKSNTNNSKILVEMKKQCEEKNKQINEMKKSLLEVRELNNWLCDVLTEANFLDSGEEQPNNTNTNDNTNITNVNTDTSY